MQQPQQQQTAAVDALVEELSLLPPRKAVIKTRCVDVAACIESGRSYVRLRDR